MNTIIIPADLSDNFYNSLNFALLFEQSKPLTILILFQNKQFEPQFQKKFEEITENYLPALFHSESTIQYYTTAGKVEEEICILVDENKDSMFFSTFYETGDSVQSGYTREDTMKLIKYTKHNVLTLPTNQVPSEINRIIFPIHHFSKVRHKVTMTATIARIFGSEVHVVNTLVTKQSKIVKQCTLYAQQVANHFRNVGIPATQVTIEGKKLAETIVDYAESNGGNLISIIPEHKSGGIFGKSYLQEMLNLSNLPLLVVAPRKSKITGSFRTSG